MSKSQISKEALVLLLLWLRGPLRLILSLIVIIGFVGLFTIPIIILSIGWSKALINITICSFILGFGSFLLIFYYDRLIRYLQ